MLEIYQKETEEDIERPEEEPKQVKQEEATQAPKKEEAKPAAPAAVKPTASTSAPKLGVGTHRGATTPSNKCPICGKTVYATEAITESAKNYHKGCFRCKWRCFRRWS
jgi:outer membrane biosynthesis protein TonB